MSSSAAPRATTTIPVGPLTLTLVGDPGTFAARLAARGSAPGLWLVELTLEASAAAVPSRLSLRWSLPCADIQAGWRGDCNAYHGPFPPDWGGSGFTPRAAAQSPVSCLHSQSGKNRLTFASDDAIHPTTLSAGLHEETGAFTCSVDAFVTPRAPSRSFTVRVRIDLRDVAMERALGEVSQWWETLYPPCAVPEVGRLPMYSTWYSFHQAVEPAAVEAECRRAKELGCEAVIVDDGWQTLDGSRGYAFCGDWESERIPDMAGHVRRVHALGMKFLLWYSVPFIGLRSKAYPRFAGRYLREDALMNAAVLDPRFPEVREYLIGVYERHLREWDLDGFKLDFVDAFTRADADASGGRDIADVDEAVVRLLSDVMARLRAIKPDILVEFRQGYVGPIMRTYGNLFRAADCPADVIGNRVRTLDIRLTCGATACHSDMVMWHPTDPVESAALQLVNVLFSVPQVSVLIERLPADHRAMLAFWLAWWREHRATLLDGELSVAHPESSYTQASARSAHERITVAFGDLATVPDAPSRVQVVNATRSDRLIVELAAPLGRRRLVVRDCRGRTISDATVDLPAGIHRLAVPAAGVALLEA
ncbi:MAG: alpha-galactosidase [Planctomycetes bacterium]|nr:alpha-galactosidase [Planctomycetota bacterium]